MKQIINTFNINHVNCFIQKSIGLIICLFTFVSTNAQTPSTVAIGNTTGAGSWFYGPIFRNTTNAGTLNYSRHAHLYTAAELNIPIGSKITKLEWLKKSGGTILNPNTFNIWLKNTSTSSLPISSIWNTLVNGAIQTYSNNNFDISIGNDTYLETQFNVPCNQHFTYDGGNLLVLTDWAKAGTQIGGGIQFYSLAATGKSIGTASSSPLLSTSVLVTAIYGNSRPTLRITYMPPTNLTLDLKLFIEGYYIGSNAMKPVLMNQGIGTNTSLCDTVEVQLCYPNPPYCIMESQKVILNTDGTTLANFPNSVSGLYYIAIKHRNGVYTWSANPVLCGGLTSYDFSTSATQAYNSNMKEVAPNVWALYSGDINQDENIDLTDLILLDNDIMMTAFGYLPTDIEGDGNVDLLDEPILVSNINNFIFSNHP